MSKVTKTTVIKTINVKSLENKIVKQKTKLYNIKTNTYMLQF